MSDFKIDLDMTVQNITNGTLTMREAVDRIVEYINQEPDKEYDIAIGTDSMTYSTTQFVLAITVHRLHSGGIFFYKRLYHDKIANLRYKITQETSISVETANLLVDEFFEKGIDLTDKDDKIHFHIHMDIGSDGPTKELIQELTGWITALGYDFEIKPDSYAASHIADRYSK